MKQKRTILESDFERKHAFRVFMFLVEHAVKNMRPYTYGEVCTGLGIGGDGLAIRYALGEIQKVCGERGLPLINYLVVNKYAHRPGEWVAGTTTEAEWRAAVIHSYVFDWSSIDFVVTSEATNQ